MAIKETTRKIYFTPFTPGRKSKMFTEEREPTVTINMKYGYITFNQGVIQEIGMEGKLVRFFYEPTRKIIGWNLVVATVDLQGLKKAKLVKSHPKARNYKTTITGILKQFTGLKEESYTLPVRKYVERQDILDKGNTYYYVQLKDGEESDE